MTAMVTIMMVQYKEEMSKLFLLKKVCSVTSETF
jgi:hypothetical protein